MFGISQSGASAKARDIVCMLGIVPLDPAWCVPSRIQDNPLAWMVTANDVVVDARMLPRELQEQAWRAGAIPFVPDANVAQRAGASEDVASAGSVSRPDD